MAAVKTANGTLKYIGLSTVVAICLIVVAYGEFKGDVKANVATNTRAIAARKVETNATHSSIWQRIGEMQKTHIEIAETLGRIDGALGAIERHIHKGD